MLCIVIDLLHCLLVVPLERHNLVLQLLDLIFQNFDIVLMSLLLLVDLLRMHLKHVCLGDSELGCLLLCLVLQLLVSGCVLQHLLGVVVTLCLQLVMVLLCKGFNLLVEIVIDLLL